MTFLSIQVSTVPTTVEDTSQAPVAVEGEPAVDDGDPNKGERKEEIEEECVCYTNSEMVEPGVVEQEAGEPEVGGDNETGGGVSSEAEPKEENRGDDDMETEDTAENAAGEESAPGEEVGKEEETAAQQPTEVDK